MDRKFCLQPFQSLHIGEGGHVFLCQCPAYLKDQRFASVGNVFKGGMLAAYNSDRSIELRASILNGSLIYCRETCPSIISLNQTRAEHIVRSGGLSPAGPRLLYLEYDLTCNLACIHCCQPHRPLPEIRKMSSEITDLLLQEVDNPEEIHIVGGEPLASRAFMRFLRHVDPGRIEKTRISFCTNGTLLDRKAWDLLSNCNHRIVEIHVSIDAATDATYRKIRIGSDFRKVIDHLSFLGRLRTSGVLRRLRVNFCVQKLNYREMGDMVERCLENHVDELLFQALDVREGLPYEMPMKDHVVHLEDSLHFNDFLNILKDPRLKDGIVRFNGDLLVSPRSKEAVRAGSLPLSHETTPSRGQRIQEDPGRANGPERDQILSWLGEASGLHRPLSVQEFEEISHFFDELLSSAPHIAQFASAHHDKLTPEFFAWLQWNMARVSQGGDHRLARRLQITRDLLVAMLPPNHAGTHPTG